MNSRPASRVVLVLSSCFALLIFLSASATSPPLFQQSAKLLAGDGATRHDFGLSLALEGNTAAIGAPGWNNEVGSYTGAVYLFNLVGQQWTQAQRLQATDRAAFTAFGSAVALDGDTLAVGALGNNQGTKLDAGAVYIFNGSGQNWSESVKLSPADLVEYNLFGASVDLAGNTLLAGAWKSDGGTNEAAYVFTRTGNTWTQQGKLSAPEAPADINFGAAVALAGDIALVGAPGDFQRADQTGAVYVYTRDDHIWSFAEKLEPGDGEPGDNFGCAIDIDGQQAVIAACRAYEALPRPGYAYIFIREGSRWVQRARLEPDTDERPFEVDSVSIDGDQVALGSKNAFGPLMDFAGTVYLFHRVSGNNWNEVPAVQPDDIRNDAEFGRSVALSGNKLLAGAPEINDYMDDGPGAAYYFTAASQEMTVRLYLPAVMTPRQPATQLESLIAYVRDDDIFTATPIGTRLTNLTRTAEPETEPAWSPDGRQLVFVRWPAAELVVMDADGSNQRVIPTPGVEYISSPAWSPQGDAIAFHADKADDYAYDQDIFIIGVDGSGLTRLTDWPSAQVEPSWAPDGNRLVFASYWPNDNYDLLILNADGTGMNVLAKTEPYERSPDFSPDGLTIVMQVHTIPSADGLLATIPAGGGQGSLLMRAGLGPKWAPDGYQFVFTGTGGGIFRMNDDGTGWAPIDIHSQARSPDWRP
jgi:Tol biopolymer transport system component